MRDTDSLMGAKLAGEIGLAAFGGVKPPLVLNFANPFEPGGGVARGAVVQEEDLCRRTTLYASIASGEALGFYEDNKRFGSRLFTHGMILSPHVEVFREAEGGCLDAPNEIAVLDRSEGQGKLRVFGEMLGNIHKEEDDAEAAAIAREREGAGMAAVAHGHPLGWISAGLSAMSCTAAATAFPRTAITRLSNCAA